jgi:hypothetical protein
VAFRPHLTAGLALSGIPVESVRLITIPALDDSLSH